MTDNLAVTPGSGATMGADLISTVLYPRAKLIHGADGTNAGDVSTANGLPVQFDQTTPGTTNGVQVNAALPAGTNTVGAVAAGVNVITGSTTTRPADTNIYALGDLVAASTTAATVNGTPVAIAAARGTDIPTAAIRCRLLKSTATITNAIFRVHFWNVAPTVANGDNGVFSATMDSSYCGSFDVTIDRASASASLGIGMPTQGSAMIFKPVSGTSNLYYLIEARATYTPASGEVFTPILEIQ